MEKIDNNGVTIKGCIFKFHQDLNGFASLVGYDINGIAISDLRTNIKKASNEDTYEIGSVVVDTYKQMGSYFKCKLYDASTMQNVSFSNSSAMITFECM